MPPTLLPAEKIEATIKQTASLIFLHGLGDTGHGWAETLRQVVPPYCKIICPHAKSLPVTINMKMIMPAWYDVHGLSMDAAEDTDGIKCAMGELAKWVDAEVSAGIKPERIVVGGFSQGGSVALYYGLTNGTQPIGGLAALSSWLPLHAEITRDKSLVKADKNLRILQCHGNSDPIVPLPMGSMTNALIQSLGFSQSAFHVYPEMGHSSSDKEMEDLKAFLDDVIPRE